MSEKISHELRQLVRRVISGYTSEEERQAWLAEQLGIIDDAVDPDWKRTKRRIHAYLCEEHGLQTYQIDAMLPTETTALLREDAEVVEAEQTEHLIQIKGTSIVIDGEALTLGGVARDWLLKLCKNAGCPIDDASVNRYQVRDTKMALKECGYDWLERSIVSIRNEGYCLGLPLNCRIEQ